MEIALTLLVIFVAAVVQGASGFGFGLVAVALLSLLVQIEDAAVLNVLPALTINCLLAGRLFASISWKVVPVVALAAVVATPVGVMVLRHMDSRHLNLILAALLLAAVLQAIIPHLRRLRFHSPLLAAILGGVSGIFAGALGAGGPALVAYVNSLGLSRHQQVATLQLLLGTMGTVRLLELIRSDMLTPAQWWTSGLCSLIVIPGALAGLWLLGKSSESIFRPAVIGLLFLIMLRSAALGFGWL